MYVLVASHGEKKDSKDIDVAQEIRTTIRRMCKIGQQAIIQSNTREVRLYRSYTWPLPKSKRAYTNEMFQLRGK